MEYCEGQQKSDILAWKHVKKAD